MDTKSKKELQDVARLLNIYAGGTLEELQERLEEEFLSDISSRTKRELQDVARTLGIYAGGSQEELEERIEEELGMDDDDLQIRQLAYQNFRAVVATWTNAEMQTFLRTYELRTGGNKATLYARILENYPYEGLVDDEEEEEEEEEEDSEEDDEDSEDAYDDIISSLGGKMRCMGLKNRKALIVACSYRNSTLGHLSGTLEDADRIYKLLTEAFDFHPEDIKILRDDLRERSKQPNKLNIKHGLDWLMEGAGPGHGSQEEDRLGTERSGFNQTICPVDTEDEGSIRDSYLHATLVKPLPHGACLHALIDSCHSGTIMNLPFNAVTDKGNFKWWENEYDQDKIHKWGSAGGHTKYSGAATYAFCSAILNHKEQWERNNITYGGLLKAMYDELREDRRFLDQTPTLSSCIQLDCKSTAVTFNI